jgi:lysophospholipase L1-like esterase
MKFILTSILVVFFFCAYSQAKIVVLGSSTAVGYGALPYSPFDNDSGWVNRLRLSFNKNTMDGVDTTVVNLALGGQTTYHVMPTSFIPPANRPSPDPDRNVTKAISLNPDAIIINLPSNDMAVGFTKSEIMNNFRSLSQIITNAGINAFITTTQPRDFSPNFLMMEYQRDLKDSIQNNFGYFSINFWDDLVGTTPPNSIRTEVSYGDGIHINNLGHFLVYQRVAAKNLFVINAILPLTLKSFETKVIGKKTLLTWETLQEDANTIFQIERSLDAIDFKNIGSIQGINTSGSTYSYTDAAAPQGKSWYRLKMTGISGIKYSDTRLAYHSNARFGIDKVQITATSLIIHLQSEIEENIEVYLVSSSGTRIRTKKQTLVSPATQVFINVSHLPVGVYYLVISTGKEFITQPVFLTK